MTNFNWKPISEVPEEYKDGRQVLCLCELLEVIGQESP
jgi:hypothetical protein